jgi:hypothetical protein
MPLILSVSPAKMPAAEHAIPSPLDGWESAILPVTHPHGRHVLSVEKAQKNKTKKKKLKT